MSIDGKALEGINSNQSDPGTSRGEAANVDLQKLALLAQQAYEQKRTKHCLALTRALLLFDPQNEQAHAIQASIRSDMQRDLQNARALTADSKDLPEKSRQAAEGLLWKILNIDPENEEAKRTTEAVLDFVKWVTSENGGQQALAEVQYPPIYSGNNQLGAYTAATIQIVENALSNR